MLGDVLKARYFKHSDVLDARRGFCPSYSWRSIWGAKALLLEGLGWRIGNGCSVWSLKDKWLLRDGRFSIPILTDESTPDCLVRDLINHETHSWDLEKLDMFDEHTKEAILAIPLSSMACRDTVYWFATKDGGYSVRSGYWLGRMGVTGSTSNGGNQVWSKIWRLNGPPKMRHFLWRACKGSLPVNAVRFHRHMHSSAVCTRCDEDDETICHALIDCADSRDVWLTSPFCSLINDAPRDSFLLFFQWLYDHSTADELLLICATLWACWMGRNKIVMENSQCDMSQLSSLMCKLVTDYKEYSQKLAPTHKSPIQRFDSWQTPDVGFIKINFDASLCVNGQRGLGAVLRNDQGEILMTGTRRVQAHWNAELSETAAALFGLEMAQRWGYTRIHLEGDAYNVILALSKKQQGVTPYHLILDNCLSSLSSFECIKLSYVRRVGNTLAHMVARWETAFGTDRVCMPPFPECLRTLEALDLS